MATKLQLRRDTSVNWTTCNPTLAAGEPGFETDTGKLKIGNGSNDWDTLPYVQSEVDLSAYALQTDLDAYSTTAEIDEKVTRADGGYEFTGGFTDRTTGQAGASAIGTNVNYTQQMVNEDRWLRFGFDPAQQASLDTAYWTSPAPEPTTGVGLFGGLHMPAGVSNLFDFDFNSAEYSNASDGGTKFTAANGSFDFTQCRPGDLALVRFDFNVLPQIANTTLEVALIWQTRNAQDEATFTFALTGDPMFFGTGTTGRTFLSRPLLSAYFASDEDVNARALLAIRADNPVQIQPLTTLVTIQR